MKSVSNVNVFPGDNQNTITWDSPSGETFEGFYVYRTDNLNGDYTRISDDVIVANSFIDTNPLAGRNIYMVRTVKLETSGSGSYFNLGLGQVDSIDFIVATEDFEENKISIFPNPSQGQFQIELESNNLSNTVLQLSLIHI